MSIPAVNQGIHQATQRIANLIFLMVVIKNRNSSPSPSAEHKTPQKTPGWKNPPLWRGRQRAAPAPARPQPRYRPPRGARPRSRPRRQRRRRQRSPCPPGRRPGRGGQGPGAARPHGSGAWGGRAPLRPPPPRSVPAGGASRGRGRKGGEPGGEPRRPRSPAGGGRGPGRKRRPPAAPRGPPAPPGPATCGGGSGGGTARGRGGEGAARARSRSSPGPPPPLPAPTGRTVRAGPAAPLGSRQRGSRPPPRRLAARRCPGFISNLIIPQQSPGSGATAG